MNLAKGKNSLMRFLGATIVSTIGLTFLSPEIVHAVECPIDDLMTFDSSQDVLYNHTAEWDAISEAWPFLCQEMAEIVAANSPIPLAEIRLRRFGDNEWYINATSEYQAISVLRDQRANFTWWVVPEINSAEESGGTYIYSSIRITRADGHVCRQFWCTGPLNRAIQTIANNAWIPLQEGLNDVLVIYGLHRRGPVQDRLF